MKLELVGLHKEKVPTADGHYKFQINAHLSRLSPYCWISIPGPLVEGAEIGDEFTLHLEPVSKGETMPKTVTEEQVEAAIAQEFDWKAGEKTTIVLLKLKNGFEVVGTSACVDAAAYDHEIGKKYARERALSKVWDLEAYVLQSQLTPE